MTNKITTKEKGANDMSPLNSFFEKNKEKLLKASKKNNKYNEKGQCLITNEDEDLHHDEWEDDK